MNNFTQILLEVNNIYEEKLSMNDLNKFIDNTIKIMPIPVKEVLFFIKKYELLDGKIINNIVHANKQMLKNIANDINIPEELMEKFWKSLKDLKNNIKLLPHFLTPIERDSLIKRKINISDITIDLDSAQGRNEVVKMYMPIVYKIVNQYVGKSKLNRSDLISAALTAFVNAMDEWDRNKGQLFKSYLSYRIQQQILNDINKYGHTLSGTNWYITKKYGSELLDAVSMDSLSKDENGEFKQDRLVALGVEDNEPLDRDEEKQWEQVFSILERKFKQRDIDIFYRYFGLAGRKREKSKDIAKEFGMSEGNIRNSIINKILLFLKSDNKALELLSNLQDLYNEGLMIELIWQNNIFEYLANDDVYILLEEINRWNNKDVFKNSLSKSLNLVKEKDIILNILKSDFEELDQNFKKYKKDIIIFLSNMYPTESMTKKTDVTLLEYMEELQIIYKKYYK